jgi:hypothetical protein
VQGRRRRRSLAACSLADFCLLLLRRRIGKTAAWLKAGKTAAANRGRRRQEAADLHQIFPSAAAAEEEEAEVGNPAAAAAEGHGKAGANGKRLAMFSSFQFLNIFIMPLLSRVTVATLDILVPHLVESRSFLLSFLPPFPTRRRHFAIDAQLKSSLHATAGRCWYHFHAMLVLPLFPN